jgi:hypothetical protein
LPTHGQGRIQTATSWSAICRPRRFLPVPTTGPPPLPLRYRSPPITRERGRVSTSDVAALRQAGFGDEEIVEIVAAVALNVFRNYFNLVAGTVIDFPVVRTGHAMLAAAQP